MAEEEDQGEEKTGSSKKLIIMIALGVVLLVAGAGGTLLFMGLSESPPEAGMDEMAEQEMAEEMAMQEQIKENKTAVYHNLHPAFVANFTGESNKRYMQVYVVAMAYDQKVIDDLEMHMPAVRNDVLMTLSAASSDDIETVEGKEILRKKVLDKMKETMLEKTGRPGIEDIYFTKFVAQ